MLDVSYVTLHVAQGSYTTHYGPLTPDDGGRMFAQDKFHNSPYPWCMHIIKYIHICVCMCVLLFIYKANYTSSLADNHLVSNTVYVNWETGYTSKEIRTEVEALDGHDKLQGSRGCQQIIIVGVICVTLKIRASSQQNH